MSWTKGKSGNAAGRPKGTGEVARLRGLIAEHVPAILKAMVEKAKAGDSGAARLLLERAIPAIKPTEEATPLALPPGTLTEQGKAVLAAVASGELATGQGSALLMALGSLAKLVEMDEMEKRLRALEELSKKGTP